MVLLTNVITLHCQGFLHNIKLVLKDYFNDLE